MLDAEQKDQMLMSVGCAQKMSVALKALILEHHTVVKM
jgi:hypothetical protein